MKYRSTRNQSPEVTLEDAVVKGLAPDNGLYMPLSFPILPSEFIKALPSLSLSEIATRVASALFGEDIKECDLRNITEETMNFPIPLVEVTSDILALELFHGPTLAFKDVGARFMARLLGYYNRGNERIVNVLVATSGDTGSAVANGFYNVKGVRVFVLYPKDKVSKIQEAQFTTLGNNITALEIDGNFDDCQRLVKTAFLDKELNEKLMLTSANSINIARFLPQMFYYFYAYAQAVKSGKDPDSIVFAVPSGNFGNITAGIIAKKMGLPIKRFIAANNSNDVFYNYIISGNYNPKKSVQTIANAMDVGDPSNFVRILDIYKDSHKDILTEIDASTYNDSQISETLLKTWQRFGYLLDPHGAVACRALEEKLKPGETGIFLETAHPAKFKETVEGIIKENIMIPERLAEFMKGEKINVELSADFSKLKEFLLSTTLDMRVNEVV